MDTTYNRLMSYIRYPGPKCNVDTTVGWTNLYMAYGAMEVSTILSLCIPITWLIGGNGISLVPAVIISWLYAYLRRKTAIDRLRLGITKSQTREYPDEQV